MRDAAIVGASPEAQLQQVHALMSPLLKHLEKHHPGFAMQCALAGQTFASYLLMTAFEIDESTKQRMGSDQQRWKIRQMMTRQETRDRVTDEKIEQRLVAVLDTWVGTKDVPPQLFDELFAVMRHLRDATLETDRYPVSSTQNESPVLVKT